MIVDLGPVGVRVSFGDANLLPEMLGHFLCAEKGEHFEEDILVVDRMPRAYDGVVRGPVWAGEDAWEFRLGVAETSMAFFYGPPAAWHIATPFRQLFAWIADRHQGLVMHAAAYRAVDKVVLIAGPSGSGKSTLAAACLSTFGPSGFLGDDWASVFTYDNDWSARQLYSSLKLSPEMTRKFGFGEPRLTHKAKNIYGIERQVLDETGAFPIGAVVVPSIAGGGLAVKPLSAAEAVLRIAPSTLLQTPGVSKNALANISKLCAAVPCYQMSVSERFLPLAPAMLTELAEW